MKDKNFLDIPGNKNVLNVEAQKELIDYTMKKSATFALKIFAIVLPVTLLLILGVFYFVFYIASHR
jgi:hypothetical protein